MTAANTILNSNYEIPIPIPICGLCAILILSRKDFQLFYHTFALNIQKLIIPDQMIIVHILPINVNLSKYQVSGIVVHKFFQPYFNFPLALLSLLAIRETEPGQGLLASSLHF